MVAYNFQHHDARRLIFGQKCSTLKPNGKRKHVAVGGVVTCFVGNVAPDWGRSPDCHRLMDAPCTRSDPVIIDSSGAILAGVRVTNTEWYRVVAKAEGFADFDSLQAKYVLHGGMPWEGQYVRWNADNASFRAQWPLIIKPPPERVDPDD